MVEYNIKDRRVSNKDLIQVDYANKNERITNILISPKAGKNGQVVAQANFEQSRQVIMKPTTLPYAQKQDKKRDNIMSRLVNSLDHHQGSAIFPSGRQNVALLTG